MESAEVLGPTGTAIHLEAVKMDELDFRDVIKVIQPPCKVREERYCEVKSGGDAKMRRGERQNTERHRVKSSFSLRSRSSWSEGFCVLGLKMPQRKHCSGD